MTFAEQIKAARKKSRKSQMEAAELAGIDHTYLSKIESGTMPPPSVDTILKLAVVYGTDSLPLLEAGGKTLCHCSARVAELEERIACLEASILGMGGFLTERRS